MTAIAARVDRSYLAGLGASGAFLTAAGITATFLIALVAFNGWPAGGNGDQAAEVQAHQAAVAASAQAASTALAAAPGAVAATPAPVTLAARGNPNSVVPNVTNPSGGSGQITDGGSGGGSGGQPTGPTQNPDVITSVVGTVNSTAAPATGPVVQAAGGVTGGLSTSLGQVANGTHVSGFVTGIVQLLNGLAGGDALFSPHPQP